MPHQFLRCKAFFLECFDNKIGRAKKSVRQLVLLLLLGQNIPIVKMLMARRQQHTQPVTFLLHHFVSKSRVCIRALQYAVGIPSLAAVLRVRSAPSGHVWMMSICPASLSIRLETI